LSDFFDRAGIDSEIGPVTNESVLEGLRIVNATTKNMSIEYTIQISNADLKRAIDSYRLNE